MKLIASAFALPLVQRRNQRWMVFALIVLVSLLLAMLRSLQGEAGDAVPLLMTFLLPIILFSYMGGLAGGLVALALTLGFGFVFDREELLAKDGQHYVLFGVDALLVCFMGELARRALLRKERAKQDLAELAHLVESTNESIVATRTDGIITRWNEGASLLFGYTAEEALGQHIALIVPTELQEHERYVSSCIQHGDSIATYASQRRCHDGRLVAVDTTVSAIRNEHHEIIGISRISRDMTEIRRSQKDLEDLVAKRTIELGQSEALFRQLFESAPVGITLFREDGQTVMANPALAAMVGATRSQLLRQNFHKIVSWQQSGLLQLAERALASGLPQRGEFKMTTSFGNPLEVEVEFILPQIQGQRHLLLVTRDISQFRTAERMLKLARDETEARAKADRQYLRVVETVLDGFFITDTNGHFLEANDTFLMQTGYELDELLNMRLADLDVHHSSEELDELLARMQREVVTYFETENRRKDGSILPIEVSASYLPDDGGRFFVFTRDITERKQSEDEIRTLAFYDPLTHLPNRRLLLDRLRQGIVSSHRNHVFGALVFIDLDNFKQLNDTLGHDMGDHLLVEVGHRLRACVRENDTVARLGGDEFIVMLEELDERAERSAVLVEMVVSKIMEQLSLPYQLGDHEHHSTPSIGVAMFCDQMESVDDVLKRADLAMYQAKSAGRNTMRFFDPNMQATVDARSALEFELRRSLRQNHILLHYQPQVDPQGKLIGVESLVRWQHPLRGLVGPAEFIQFAEESGLILPLGQRVLEIACQQVGAWREQANFAEMTVAVNVSARQFLHADFVVQICTAIEENGIRPERLKLELTESLLLYDISESTKKMHELKKLGVSFSLDDFGTGYSSLSYLKLLPLDQLKIDRSFVRDILTDPNDAAIVRAIIAMGHSLGLMIVAEGVETAEQWRFLLDEGCDIGQGYYFSRPVPVAEFEQRWSSLH